MRSSQRKPHDERSEVAVPTSSIDSTVRSAQKEAENVTDSNENGAIESPSTCSSLTRCMSSSTIVIGSENDSCLPYQDSATLSHNSNSRLQEDDQKRLLTHKKKKDNFTYSSTNATTTSTISEMEDNKPPQYFGNNDSMFNDEDLILQQHVIIRQIQREVTDTFSESNNNKIESKHYFDGESAMRDSLKCILAHSPKLPIPASRSSSTSHLASSSIQSHHNKAASPQHSSCTQHSFSSSSRTTNSKNSNDENLLKIYDDPSAIEEQLRIMEQIEIEKRRVCVEMEKQQQAYNPAEIEEQRRIMEQIEKEKQREEIHQQHAADPSEIDQQNRIMAQIQEQQQRHQREERASIKSSSTDSEVGRVLISHRPVQQELKKRPIPVPSRRRSLKDSADDDLTSSVYSGRPSIVRLKSSHPPGAAVSSGRTKYRSLLQKDEHLTTSSSPEKKSIMIHDTSSSAFRRPSLAVGSSPSHSSEGSAARRKKYKSLLQKDEDASFKAEKHAAADTKNCSEDRIAEIYGGKKLHIYGTKQTMEDIATGNAIFVQCPGCQTVLQVGSKAKLLYCTICTAVSPIDLVHDATGRNDSCLAKAFQEEEVEIKLTRKVAENKPRWRSS